MFESVHIDKALLVFASGSFSDKVWARLMAELQKKPISVVMAANVGGLDINSVQRKEGNAFSLAKGIRVVTITDDRIARGIATASAWVGVNISSFAWKELDAAVRDAGFTDRERAAEVANTLLGFRRNFEKQASVSVRAG